MKTIQILFVEDSPMIMEISKRMITNLGYEADYATSGEEALAMFENKEYDLVLTDLGLPNMSGEQLIAKMRKYERRYRIKESRICAITAYRLKDVRDLCLASGVNSVCNKPLQMPMLVQAIQECQNF